ncbi:MULTISPECIES: septum formation initiator [unclassified Micromonospora]|uniref:septum formation initiator n=1 Tax=unclassified Micromonospora TaxID=2617518 RepID=UPI00098D6E1C|nr:MULTISPECIES: septum formation initiator [unclassified Micromonospora]OON27168.1 septum formation initiator [Micromonospora sp. Rc5]
MRRRSLLAVAGWLATAVLATLVGVAAIRLVGESITGTPGGVRSQEEVERALAAPAPTASGTSSPGVGEPTGPAGPGARRAFATAGGTAVAECGPGGVRLVSWAPAQDHRVADVDRGPDDDVEVTFVGPGGEHELKVRCVGGEPVAVADD